jgi:hypothetical protein
MKRIVPLGLVSLALALSACGGGGSSAPSAGSLAGKTAKQVLASALAAAKTSGSVHFTVVGKDAGRTETIVGDASTTEGRETITSGDLSIQAEVVGKGAYIEGNAGGLEAQMGLTAALAKTYADQWISVASSEAPYSTVSTGVRLAGALANIQPAGKLTLTAPTTKDGQSVIGVHGEPPGTLAKGTTGSSVLYVATGQPTIPLVFQVTEATGANKESDVGTYSNWGKALNLVAPTKTVPLSSIPSS